MAYDEKLVRLPQHIFSDWINDVTEAVSANTFWAGQTAFGKTYIIAEFPTAESLAKHFFDILSPKISVATNGAAKLTSVTFKETPTSVAIYRPDF